MSELRRLLDDTDDLEIVRVLRTGLDDEPSDESFARAARVLGVGAAGAAGLAAIASGSAKPAGLGASSLGLAFAKWLGVGLLAGGVVVTPLALRSPAPPSSQAASESRSSNGAPGPEAQHGNLGASPTRAEERVEPEKPRQPAANARANREPIVAPPAEPPAEAPSVARFESAGESALVEETRTLDSARRALQSGDPATALAALARHDRLTQKKLGAEATLLRVRALVAAGRAAEAQRIARETLAARGADGHACRLAKLAGLADAACSER